MDNRVRNERALTHFHPYSRWVKRWKRKSQPFEFNIIYVMLYFLNLYFECNVQNCLEMNCLSRLLIVCRFGLGLSNDLCLMVWVERTRWRKNGAGECLHDSMPHWARIIVEFHKLSLISIVDESLTCKLNASWFICCFVLALCSRCRQMHIYAYISIALETIKSCYKILLQVYAQGFYSEIQCTKFNPWKLEQSSQCSRLLW